MARAEIDSSHARRIEIAVRSVLPPSVRVQLGKKQASTVALTIAGHRINARWLGGGWASEIRAVLKKPGPRPDVLVARQMSPGARELLSSKGIGWIDELGAAEIAIGTIVVSRTGHIPDPAKKPSTWTPAVLSVGEALLCGTGATVALVQKATGLSSGSCTNALRMLTELRLLEAQASRGRASARRIVNPDELLEAYASAAAASRPPLSIVIGVTWRDPVVGLTELGAKWTKMKIAWAATGAAAAAVLAPLLTTVASATVYVDAGSHAELTAIAARSDLRPMDGGRLTLATFPTVSTQRLVEMVGGIKVAPWPRVYSDLRTIGVRGEEAAEHLREVMRGG